MKNIANKAPGDQYVTPEFNSWNGENKNTVEDTAQTLSEGDNHQVSKSMSNYSAGGAAYHDSGSANAYILSRILPYQAITTLRDQMKFRFRASHSNTGASTVSVETTGAKAIKNRNGSILTAGEIVAGDESEIVYDSSAGGHYTLTSRNDAATNIPFAVAVESSPNVYTIDLGGIFTAYNDSVYFRCRFPSANTGSITLNVDGLGAKTVSSNFLQDPLAANEIKLNVTYLMSYNSATAELNLVNHAVREETMDYPNFGNTGGTASALTLTPSPAVRALENNMFFLARMGISSNDASASLSVSGIGSKRIYAEGLDVLQQVEANTMRGGVTYLFSYSSGLDGGSGGFILMSIAGSSLAEAQAGASKTHFIPPHLLALMTQENKYIYAATAGGPTAYTASVTPALTAYPDNGRFFIRISVTNTGSSTLNFNGLGAKPIESPDLQPLIGGELVSGVRYLLIYRGAQFQLMTPTLDTVGTLTKAGASKNVSVTPHSVKYSQHAITMSVNFHLIGGPDFTINEAVDITSVTWVSTGIFRVNFAVTMANVAYRAFGNSEDDAGTFQDIYPITATRLTTSIEFQCRKHDSGDLEDVRRCNVMITGQRT